MSDEQLRGWADDALGIVVPMNTPRTVLLTKIVNAAVAASDGLT